VKEADVALLKATNLWDMPGMCGENNQSLQIDGFQTEILQTNLPNRSQNFTVFANLVFEII
jgi:hypothetical protein